MNPQVSVVSLWAEDVPAAVHFYRDVIGLRLLPHHQTGQPHFDVDGTYLTVLQGQPRPPRNPTPAHFPLIAFAVEDLDSAVDRLRAHHVELPWGIDEDPRSRWVMFYDPAGNLIELVEFKHR